MIGPNVKKLVAYKMATDAIPVGSGVMVGVMFLTDPKLIAEAAKASSEWVTLAIEAIRQTGEPNPWKQATDEDIAGELLRKIDERKKR